MPISNSSTKGKRSDAIQRERGYDLCAYLTENPPHGLVRRRIQAGGQPPTLIAYCGAAVFRDRLEALGWSGIDITKESQRESGGPTPSNCRTIERIEGAEQARDLSMTTALAKRPDIVGISLTAKPQPRLIKVDLYHLRYSAASTRRALTTCTSFAGRPQQHHVAPATGTALGSRLSSPSLEAGR